MWKSKGSTSWSLYLLLPVVLSLLFLAFVRCTENGFWSHIEFHIHQMAIEIMRWCRPKAGTHTHTPLWWFIHCYFLLGGFQFESDPNCLNIYKYAVRPCIFNQIQLISMICIVVKSINVYVYFISKGKRNGFGMFLWEKGRASMKWPPFVQ